MSTFVFGIRVTLDDYQNILSQDTTIGLYNVSSDLSGDAASEQAIVNVDDGTYFRVGAKIKISDDTPQSETEIIAGVNGNQITLLHNLDNTYTTAQNAKLESNSEFRWLYNAVSGLSNWNTDMLSEKGLSKIIKSANIEQGGNVADIGGITVKLKNTQKFYKDLDDLGISLLGKRVEEIYFEDTTESTAFDGNCNNVSAWTKGNYTFSAAKPRNKRNALMSRELNSKDDNLDEGSSQIGKMIPLTWGHWKDKPVKFIRSADKEITYINQLTEMDSENDLWLVIYPTEPEIYRNIAFPVTGSGGGENPDVYGVRIAQTSSQMVWWKPYGTPVTTGIHQLPYFVGMYMGVVDGAGKGQFRKITAAEVDLDTNDKKLLFTIDSVFTLRLAVNTDAKADDQSWVKMVDIDRQYIAELAKCKSFLNADGEEISTGLDLFIFDSEKKVSVSGNAEIVPVKEKTINYIRMPQYIYEDIGDGNKNKIKIDVNLFDGNPDDTKTVFILPIEGFKKEYDSDLSKWMIDVSDNNDDYTRQQAGVFHRNDDKLDVPVTVDEAGSYANVTDGDDTLGYRVDVRDSGTTPNPTSRSKLVYVFRLPDKPENVDFSRMFLGIIMRSASGLNMSGDSIRFRFRKFMGYATEILDDAIAVAYIDKNSSLPLTYGTVKSLPDFYFDHNNDKNLFFYFENADVSGDYLNIYGHTRFEFPGIDKESYDSVKECCVMLYHKNDGGASDQFRILEIFELAIMFEKSISTKTEIYTFLKARIFNDTFEGRKTSADLQESIIDIFETICRSQDYSDRGIMPDAGWGKAYSESALIKLSSTGSFDSTRLNEVKAFKCARQVLDKSSMNTEKLKKTICQNFFLLNYQDKDGKECLVPLEKSLTSPSNIITLADIRLVNGLIKVKPANPNNIYPEPFVRYYKDIGADKYDGYIGITNVTAEAPSDSEKASYVIGNVSSDEAIALYNMCVTNYNISGIIIKPPSQMTDLLWANGVLVNAEEIAKWYIFKWVNWMGLKKISFPVHFTHESASIKTRDWNVGQTFLLQLPHETNNVQIECLCCRHIINPDSPHHIQIEAFMLDTIESPFFIQEVMYTAAEGADLDVQETMEISDTQIQEVT